MTQRPPAVSVLWTGGLVLDGPLFEREIAIEAFSSCEQDTLFHISLQAFGIGPD